MTRNRRQSGEGQMGCIVGLILFLAAVFVAYKIIPAKVRAAELRETVVDEAKSAGSHSDDRMRKAILAKAKEEDLPVTEKNIEISRAHDEINVEVSYDIPIVFPGGYTYMQHQDHHAQNPIF
jgi:hypothetical protein